MTTNPCVFQPVSSTDNVWSHLFSFWFMLRSPYALGSAGSSDLLENVMSLCYSYYSIKTSLLLTEFYFTCTNSISYIPVKCFQRFLFCSALVGSIFLDDLIKIKQDISKSIRCRKSKLITPTILSTKSLLITLFA